MSDAATETRSFVIEREMPCPPDRLWRALTQPHLIEEWLLKSDFAPVAGHKFTLVNEPKPGVRIVIDSEVLEIEAHKTLSYRWDAMGLESVVTFTLTPTDTGTHLRMEQAGFKPDQKLAFGGAMQGWQVFLTKLETIVAKAD